MCGGYATVKSGHRPDAGEKYKGSGRAVQHGENGRENLSSQSAGHEQGNRYQNLQVSRLEQRARCESNRRALLRTRLFQTEQKLSKQTAELQHARNELERTTGTTAWKLIQRYWPLNIRLLPSGTGRRDVYDRVRQLASRILGLDGVGPISPQTMHQLINVKRKSSSFPATLQVPRDYCAGTLIVRGRVISGAALQSVEILLCNQQIAGESAGHCGGHLRCSFGSTNRSRFGSPNLTT
jgi:hypothetical protein